jgi:hypothetical protein
MLRESSHPQKLLPDSQLVHLCCPSQYRSYYRILIVVPNGIVIDSAKGSMNLNSLRCYPECHLCTKILGAGHLFNMPDPPALHVSHTIGKPSGRLNLHCHISDYPLYQLMATYGLSKLDSLLSVLYARVKTTLGDTNTTNGQEKTGSINALQGIP